MLSTLVLTETFRFSSIKINNMDSKKSNNTRSK